MKAFVTFSFKEVFNRIDIAVTAHVEFGALIITSGNISLRVSWIY